MVARFFGLRGRWLNLAVAIIAGTDFLLFGYDQGVMGGILTTHQFLDEFPIMDPDSVKQADFASHTAYLAERSHRSTVQGISVASYNLGCFIGAVITIWIGNPLGRKKMIFLGTAIMVVGAALQASATTIEHFVVGRIITGIGNGGNTSTVPTWQSETSRSHKRGKLVMIEGALITGGITISYWIDLGMSFVDSSVSWRFPLAFQIFFCLVILGTVWNLPESPRWLILKGREEEAKEVLAALADTTVDDEKEVKNEFVAIKETVETMAKGTFKDLFTQGKDRNFHRALLAYINQMFQQISGINLITYYAAVIYKGLGMGPFLSLLLAALNGTEYFLASWPPVFLVERVGRRKLMLFGAIGMSVTMAVLAGVNSQFEKLPSSDPSRMAFGIAGIVFLFVFNTFFAIGWLGMTWLYPAEIVPLPIRAPANALSTSANWIFNFLVVMITPVSFENIGYQTYIIFAVINGFMVPSVYFFYPETAYRSLEEMDSIFHKVSGFKGWFNVVQKSFDEPRRYGKNGELLIAFDEVDSHKGRVHHHDGGRTGSSSDGQEAEKGQGVLSGNDN